MTKAKTIPTSTRRDFLGAIGTTGTAAAATAGLIGLTVQPAKPDHIGDFLATNPDAELVALGRRLDALVSKMDAMPYDLTPEEDAEHECMADEACDLTRAIAAAPAVSLAGIKVKIAAAVWLYGWEASINPQEPGYTDEQLVQQVLYAVRAMEG